jgi:DnaJ-class molecular chaperone
MILEKRCPFCKGQGTLPDPAGVLSKLKHCPVCMGRGFNLVPKDAKDCGFCRGKGRVLTEGGGNKQCPDCGGMGSVW